MIFPELQQTITYLIGQVMIHVLIAISSIVFIFAYSLSTGWIALSCIPFYVYWFFIIKTILEAERGVMEAHALNESNYIDRFRVRNHKSRKQGIIFLGHNSNVYGFFQDRDLPIGQNRNHFNFFAETIGVLLLLMVLGWASYLVISKIIMVGVLVAILQMASQLIPSIRELVLTNIRLQEARVAFERMYEFTSLEPEYDAKNNNN